MTTLARPQFWTALVLLCSSLSIGCDGPTSQGGAAGTGNPGTASTTPQPSVRKIATTTGMVTDIVRQVVGSHGTATGLIEAGVDPHLFKPTRGHVKQLYDADIVFYSGAEARRSHERDV